MFTGIVARTARLEHRTVQGDDQRLRFQVNADFLADCEQGDSISVSGVCLTAIEIEGEYFSADISVETLDRTTLGSLAEGECVNLERSVRVGDRLDGHLVSGHVDGLATLLDRQPDGRSQRLSFEAPIGLMRYIAEKGSVCLDGVSLTVNDVQEAGFSVCVIPHTLNVTTLGALAPGQHVNLEVDLVARYIERLATGEDKT